MNKIKYPFYAFLTLIILLVFNIECFSQVELVPSQDRIYNFLDRMMTNKAIENFSSSISPISRREIAHFLIEINGKRSQISASDKKILDDYLIEYEYEINGTIKNSETFFPRFKFSEIFRNKKQKYLLAKTDSNATFFWDAIGDVRYFVANGDSLGKPHVLLGELGTRLRGTLFKTVGYYLRISNGVRLGGTQEDALISAQYDPRLASTRKYIGEESKTFDSFEGYLRYAPEKDWLGLTVGREALKFGTGFIDQLILSDNNSAPFDFLKLDLKYKKLRYSFFHASIVGADTAGNQLNPKYLVFHRLEFGPIFNNVAKFGFSEMLIYSNQPINFAFLNPVSFITSADLNTELPNKNANNTLLGIDAQLYPLKKLTIQGTFLIDDIDFKTIFKNDISSDDNKFGYQAGLNWQDAFGLRNLGFTYEFTKIDPFVYSHRTISDSYTNWNLPLGHSLPPNSDEHAVKLSYDIGSRFNIAVTFKHQRSGENFIDSTGKLINVGSNILLGDSDFVRVNGFLDGQRVNRNIFIAELTWQPIWQYYFSIKFQNELFDYIDQGRKLTNNTLWFIFRVDY